MSEIISASEKIQDIDVSMEMKDSFLEYSYSVIYARALPDARDGLKPVHRRIIYQMGEMGLRPDRGHVKSARVTGEVMGKLHPHGDSAIYDALVRMAQDFSLRYPLIDGHGNFGSLDDGPAAARYTEARLAPVALVMNESLDEDVVDFKPNYDAQLSEPEVLPAAFPNLLVNGSAGIAVGMATNMAPHNLREVIAGAIHLLDHPEATLDDLMAFIPGPDLPTGATILGIDGIRDAYASGRGSFKMRAKTTVETVGPRKLGIVVSALPYLVGPEKVIEKIKDGVNSKRIVGISAVTDLTDRANGMKLVIELKTGFDPNVVLELLYKFTPMEESFAINAVALVNGRPESLGLRDLLGVYLAHRVLVVRRRSSNRLGKRTARLHLVEGLLVAIESIDEVIQVIRSSDEVAAARERLMQIFDLSEIQAEYILELKLRRLTKFSRIELETEQNQLKAEIAELRAILADDSKLRSLVADELREVAKTYGDDRRSTIQDGQIVVQSMASALKSASAAELSDEPCSIVVTAAGQIARLADTKDLSGRYLAQVSTTTRSDLGFAASDGSVIRIHAADIPEFADEKQLSSAPKVNDFLGISAKFVSLIDLNDTSTSIAIGTKQGVVKRVLPEFPDKHEFEIISLKEGDAVVGLARAGDDAELIFTSKNTQTLIFPAASVRPQGRPAGGMAGISLSENDEVIYFDSVKPESSLVSAACSDAALPGTDPGSAKQTPLAEFPRKGRATGGVRSQKLLKGEDRLYFAAQLSDASVLFDETGREISVSIPTAKRDASGQKLSSPLASCSY